MAHADCAIRVAVLGAGTVGTQVVRILREHSDDLRERVGAPLKVTGVAVRDLDRDRGEHVPRELLTADAHALVQDADIVVELMGGIEPARTLITAALEGGASVVSANKALIAAHGPELHQLAATHGVDLSYEAAVAGAIPILRPLRESLAGDQVTQVLGIVNGTTNFILDAMITHGISFAEALERAQELGYAEADPTADVAGHDAAAKAAIIGALAFHSRVDLAHVHCEGITEITPAHLQAAKRMGRTVKLLAIVERVQAADGREGISARVHPALIPLTHPLANVRDAYNAVFVTAEASGSLMFYGQGAGGAPTASAVMGDVVSAARHRVHGSADPGESSYAQLAPVPLPELFNSFYVALTVVDEPGVLAHIAGILSDHSISISTIHQELLAKSGQALIGITTHRAGEAAISTALDELRAHATVTSVDAVLRMEGH